MMTRIHIRLNTQNGSNMRTRAGLLIMSISMILTGCSSTRISTSHKADNLQDSVINLAIRDFSTNCHLFKIDSVFHVSYRDSVFRKGTVTQINQKDNEDRLTHRFVRGDVIDGVVCVSIIGNGDYKFYYSEETMSSLPNRYAVINGALFYWWDNRTVSADEIVQILKKYNLFQTYSIIPVYTSDEKARSADYYFCGNDLSKYKKVLSNKGIGNYNPPIPHCRKHIR